MAQISTYEEVRCQRKGRTNSILLKSVKATAPMSRLRVFSAALLSFRA